MFNNLRKGHPPTATDDAALLERVKLDQGDSYYMEMPDGTSARLGLTAEGGDESRLSAAARDAFTRWRAEQQRVVFKHPLAMSGEPQSALLHEGAEVVLVGDQRGTVMLWALEQPSRPKVERWFRIVATGDPIEYHEDVIGTAAMLGWRRDPDGLTVVTGALVWTVVERTRYLGELER